MAHMTPQRAWNPTRVELKVRRPSQKAPGPCCVREAQSEGMEKKMEATIVYWGYVGIMENKMETTGIIGLYRDYRGYIRVISG